MSADYVFWLLRAGSWVSIVFLVLSLIGSGILSEKHEGTPKGRNADIRHYAYWCFLPFSIAAVCTWGGL